MPNHTANQAALRADGHSMRVYLTALIGSVIWSGTISATPAAKNATNLIVTGVSGAHTAVRRGMRVVIKTSVGAYKGTLNVRHAGTISSVNLPVREFSRGHVEVANGDVFEVWNDFQLVDRLVAATEGFEPDGEAYTDQNSLLAPVGASGGWWAGEVDDGETYATVALVGAAYTIDEDSGGTVTYLTTLPSGVVFAPGSGATDASPTLRADGGYHVIERTFTDVSNGKTETQYVVVSVSDADHPPYDVPDEITISGERGRGWGVNGLRLFGDTSLAALPDRCPVILWCSERINGVTQSFGVKATGRSHILCVGYLRRETGKIDGRGNEHTFDIIAPLTRLAELPGFSKVMLRDAAPDAWSKIEGLTVKRAIVQLLRHYTNALQLFDLLDDGFSDCAYSTLYLQKQVPVEQVRELASSRDGSVNADATGRMELQQLLELTPLANRAAVTRTITLGLDDIIVDKTEGIGVEIIREHDRLVETFRMRGYTAGETADDNNAIFAKWAASPGTGTQSSTVERAIADDVPSLYERTAMRGAWEDRIYINAADENKAYHAPEVRLTLPGSYRGLFQFYREYVLLDLDETTNPRGIDLRVFLFIVTSVEIQIKRGTARVVLTLRAATYAEGAVDDTPAAEVETPYEPPITLPPPVTVRPISRVPEWTDELPVKMFILSYSEVKAAKATSLTPGGTITWTDISTGLSGTGIWARSDPYNYFRRFVLTTDGLYVCDDIWASSPSWSQRATNAAMFGDSARRGYKLLMSHMVKGWIMALSGDTGAAVSFDYGYTWTQVSIKGGSPSWGTSAARGGDAEICGRDANHLYSLTQASHVSYHDVWRSTDGGLTWAATGGQALNGGGLANPMCLHIPYAKAGGAANNDDGNLHLYTTSHSSGPQAALQKSTNGGASFGTVVAGGGYVETAHSYTGNPFVAFTHDANYWYFAGVHEGSTAVYMNKTANDFSTWSSPFSDNGFYRQCVNGWSMNPDAAVTWNTGGHFYVTLDGFATWFGNMPVGWANGVAYAEFDLSDFIRARG